MPKKWDEGQLSQFEQQANTMASHVHSTQTMQSEEPGQTPTEEQLDFESIWAQNLKDKYGIAQPYTEEDFDDDIG